MAIKITASGKLISESLEANFKEQIKKGLIELAGEARNEIWKRTLAGRNADDQQFEAYSKQYTKFKAEHGKDTKPPNMTFSGDMLKGMQSTGDVRENAGRFSIEIGFTGQAEEKAEKVQKIKNYQFFGFGKKIQNYINKRIEDLISLKEANK